MSRRARAVGLLLVLVVVAACGGGGDAKRAETSPSASGTTPAAGPNAGTSAPASTPSKASSTTAATARSTPKTRTTSELLVPRVGSYVYDQWGSERFCPSVGACSTRSLPATRTISLSETARTADSVTMDFAGQVSHMRYTRDTFRFTRTRGLLMETYVRFSYGGSEFENSYTPDPPIEAIRLPITSGAKWSGSWQADTYGTYTVEVGAREPVAVGGRTVRAFRVHVVSKFTGDVDGTQDLTVWIDPATGGTVRSAGTINARTFLGRYDTTFDATLRDGPGY